MRIVGIFALAGVALSGCTLWPSRIAKQDVDFLRGCWVAGDSAGVNFRLRLLPDGKYLAGDLDSFPGDDDLVPKHESHITIARDGSTAVVVKESGHFEYTSDPMANSVGPDGWRRAMWAPVVLEKFGGIQAHVKDDKLMMTLMSPEGGEIVNAVREPCD